MVGGGTGGIISYLWGKGLLATTCDYITTRAYTEKRACNSLCTVRTHPTSYQRRDMLKIGFIVYGREQVGGVIYGVIIMGVYIRAAFAS